MVPVNPAGSKLAVPSPLSATPVPVHSPFELVGSPVKVMASALSHNGAYSLASTFI